LKLGLFKDVYFAFSRQLHRNWLVSHCPHPLHQRSQWAQLPTPTGDYPAALLSALANVTARGTAPNADQYVKGVGQDLPASKCCPQGHGRQTREIVVPLLIRLD